MSGEALHPALLLASLNGWVYLVLGAYDPELVNNIIRPFAPRLLLFMTQDPSSLRQLLHFASSVLILERLLHIAWIRENKLENF
jgi:hypothetical protein